MGGSYCCASTSNWFEIISDSSAHISYIIIIIIFESAESKCSMQAFDAQVFPIRVLSESVPRMFLTAMSV